jgi:hypothetical protein
LLDVDRKIKNFGVGARTKLDQKFFWDSVAPILRAAGSHGMTGMEIRQALEAYDIGVDPARFRIFLTRQGKRGLIELVRVQRGHGRWRLSQDAQAH